MLRTQPEIFSGTLVALILSLWLTPTGKAWARAVVGGLTGSTLITLVFIPVVYSLFHRTPQGDRK